MAPIGNAVFATLLMNDGYLPGAMVLGHSLKDRGAKGKLVVFILADKLSSGTITELKTVYDEVIPVQQMVNRTPANLYLMDRPDLISTFTKIELWRQTQYKRIVYIDADVVALRAPNELLTLDTEFAAVPDIGWPDCFNSGLLVLNPNMADYYALLALAERGISFDGADQGLLNMHFTEWERLSFVYNCTPSGNYQYVPAYRHFQSSISLVHFIGREKPWNAGRSNSSGGGVYGELLGRWWAVYDRHYRAQQTIYYTGSWQDAPRKVQDYVAGEETIYLPGYQAPRSNAPSQSFENQPTGPPPPSIMVQSPSSNEPHAALNMEQPLGDQPHVEEQIRTNDFKPTSTAEQRRWSAPHVEWEPSRAPPPPNSKPEASNFPSTIYEMSGSRDLFRPPAHYPDAPKDMWYQVPEKVAAPAKPNPIFPWEARAPKPTRVFVEPSLPSPPPEPVSGHDDLQLPVGSDTDDQGADTTPSATTDATAETFESADTPKEPYVDPWTTFNQRTNAWDEMPEITRYMQAFSGAKKGKIEVLHHTPFTITTAGGSSSPTTARGRRPSLIITDFPSANDRPSLPVTPAPIKRATIWGDDKEEEGDLPGAEGVPKQEEWVRRFSSYPQPQFNTVPPLVHEVNGVLCFKCQHCGQQNPIAKLEELQRRQSLLASEFTSAGTPPQRDMPESSSKDAVVEAAEKAMTPPSKVPLKPILKQPSFELSPDEKSTYAADAAGEYDGVGTATRISEYDLSPQATEQNTLVNSGQLSYISDDTLAHVLEDNLSPMTTIEATSDGRTTTRTERTSLMSNEAKTFSSNTTNIASSFYTSGTQSHIDQTEGGATKE